MRRSFALLLLAYVLIGFGVLAVEIAGTVWR